MATPNQQINPSQKPMPQQGQKPFSSDQDKQSPPNPNPGKGELMGDKKHDLDSSQSGSQFASGDIDDVADLQDDDNDGKDGNMDRETPAERNYDSQTNQAKR